MRSKQQQSVQRQERVFSYYNLQLRTRSNSRNAPKTFTSCFCVNSNARRLQSLIQKPGHRSALMSSNKQHLCAHFHHFVQLFDVFVAQADASIGIFSTNLARIVRALDAITGPARAQGARAKRVFRTGTDLVRPFRIALLHRGRRTRPRHVLPDRRRFAHGRVRPKRRQIRPETLGSLSN